MSDSIKKEDWSLYADRIRSEQIPAKELSVLFEKNPEFSAWYFKCFTTPR